MNKWYKFNPGSHGKLWDTLFAIRTELYETVRDITKNVMIALYEDRKFPHDDLAPHKIAMHLHDCYFHGKYWKYDFTTKILIKPELKFVKIVHVGFPEEWFVGLKGRKGFRSLLEGQHDVRSTQIVVVDRDTFGGMVAGLTAELDDYESYSKANHYRNILNYVQEKEEE